LTNFGAVVIFAFLDEVIAVSFHFIVVLPKIQDVLKEVAIADIF
jgi:hypothetical protein